MNTTDQLRAALRDLEARARQAELDQKIGTFADQADRFLRNAAIRAGELAAENRDRIDATLAQVGESVDSRTDGKYHSYVDKVRSGGAERRRLGGRAAGVGHDSSFGVRSNLRPGPHGGIHCRGRRRVDPHAR